MSESTPVVNFGKQYIFTSGSNYKP